MTAAPLPPLDVVNRFDAAAAWAALHETVRTAIGTAVLSGLAACELADHGEAERDDRYMRLGLAGEAKAADELARLLDEIEVPGLDGPSGVPLIPALLGMVCACCGRTEMDACPSGCGWARENLCTACAAGTPAQGAPAGAA